MSGPRTLRIGTRGSALALWQTERIRELLRAAGQVTERVEIRTTGDMVQDVPLARIGSRALFTRQIDDAMLEGRIDLAVHSLKDLPTELPAGIVLAAVSEREDPRDALVGRAPLTWNGIPRGATLATSSLRRRAQLLHLRPDLQVADIRGNVDTRLAKLDASTDCQAILLATAGLVRLGLAHRIGERLAPEVMLPAPGQGALAVTAREDDAAAIATARSALHHTPTALAVSAERGFLRRLEGGCQVPVGAFARVDAAGAGGHVLLHGRVVSLEGDRVAEGFEEAQAADEPGSDAIGVALAERLLVRGAAQILASVRAAAETAPLVSEP
ncbi:MAG: hydroxymethylbilane synthase [Gemmatimonadales bacterium]|nr:hydroxymethylbilane synthase [Gemmatimonadales bacterium]